MEVLQENNQYIIKIPYDLIDAPALDKLLKDIRLREILSKRQGTEEQAERLANEISSTWWEENKNRFVK